MKKRSGGRRVSARKDVVDLLDDTKQRPKRKRSSPEAITAKSSSTTSNNNNTQTKKNKKKKKAGEDDDLMAKIPARPCPNVSLRAYREHIRNNKVRVLKNLGADEEVKDEEDILEDIREARHEYEQLLTAEVQRFVMAKASHHHKVQETKEREFYESVEVYKKQQEQAEARKGEGQSIDLTQQERDDEDDHLPGNNEDTYMDTDGKNSNDGEDSEQSKERQAEATWEAFLEDGLKVSQDLEVFDKEYNQWFESKIVEIKLKGRKTVESIAFEDHGQPVSLKVHYFGFGKKYDTWIKFPEGNLAKQGSLVRSLLAPPQTHTSGKKFPYNKRKGAKPGRKKIGRVEIVMEDDYKHVGCDVDPTLIVSGPRRRQGLFPSIGEFFNKRKRESKKTDGESENGATKLLNIDVCCLCGEKYHDRDLTSDEQLHICSGGCNLAYHAKCLGKEIVDDSTFVCDDCVNDTHSCVHCTALDRERPEEKPIHCSFPGCGRYYHLSCLKEDFAKTTKFLDEEEEGEQAISVAATKQGEEEIIASSSSSSSSSSTSSSPKPASTEGQEKKPRSSGPVLYHCPGHTCLTCFENTGGSKKYGVPPKMCIGCSNAYHEKCTPYGTIRNDIGFLCNVCARSWDPPLSRTSEIAFVEQRKARQQGFVEIDFTRYFQHCASMLAPEKLENMRLPPEIAQAFQVENTIADEEEKKRQKIVEISESQVSRMPKFQPIRTNAYVKCKPVVHMELHDSRCRCERVCGDNCDNRLMRVECHGDNCGVIAAKESGRFGPGKSSPGGNKKRKNTNCTNMQFQNLEYKDLRPIETPGRGWGLITLEDCAEGDFMIEYVGEVFSAEEARRRLTQAVKSKKRHVFQMDIGDDQIIDARSKGNLARFINHSCDPNCVLHKWNVKGITKVGIFAKRKIHKGEELSFDYSFDASTTLDFTCLCGSQNCRGSFNQETTRSLQLKQELEQLHQKLKLIHRTKAEARGGLIKKQTLKKLVEEEDAYYQKLRDQQTAHGRRLTSQKAPRAKAILAIHQKESLHMLKHESGGTGTRKPYLWRNVIVGHNLEQRLSKKQKH